MEGVLGWAVLLACVNAERRDGLERISVRSCFLCTHQLRQKQYGIFCAYDLSSRIRGSHCAPGSGIAVCSGMRDACVYAPGVSGGGGGGNGGCPPVIGVPVLLSSALFGFGGGKGGVLASYCCDILWEAQDGKSPDVPWLSDIVRMEKQSSAGLRCPGGLFFKDAMLSTKGSLLH